MRCEHLLKSVRGYNASKHGSAIAILREWPEALSRRNSKFPVLTQEEESAYARQWRYNGDREAAFRLVTSHLRLVAKIAMQYRGYRLPIADIVSEGNVGLMQAVKRFDPERDSPGYLRDVVDQGDNPGICFAVVVPGQDLGRLCTKEAVL